jgi:thioredoxin reductase (NADPH)
MEPTEIFDCAVIGGGFAGLSAAVNLGRMRRSVAVIDDREGRSLWGQFNHNYLGFPDGASAAELHRRGRQQAANYGADFFRGRVVDARILEAGRHFSLNLVPQLNSTSGLASNIAQLDAQGQLFGERYPAAEGLNLQARKLILATGVRDFFPIFPGFAECVGRSLFWCIQCDGYEAIDHTLAVVGDDEEAAETALDLLEFTSHISLVAGSSDGFRLSDGRLVDLRENNILSYPCAVREYQHTNGQIQKLILADAAQTRLSVEMIFAYRQPQPRNEVAKMLGVALNSVGHIVIDTEQHTNVPGVYAAGDVTSPHDHQVSAAAHEGNQAACGVNYDLYRRVQQAPAPLV